jgi:hypothetical protein
MKNLTAARDAVGSEEPIATGGWCFCTAPGCELRVGDFGFRNPARSSKFKTPNAKLETD